MKCTDCQRVDVFASPSHTKVGLSKCPDDPLGSFRTMNYERECSKFKPMTEQQLEDRREKWRLMMNPAPKAKPEQQEE